MGKLIESYKPGDRKRGVVAKRPKEIFKYDGWASCEEHKPIQFDLVIVKDKNNNIQRGWWTGYVWDFGSKRILEPVYWRTEDIYIV